MALGYFQNNRDRMTYDKHLAKGLPIASGIIESTCNSIINIRKEGAGMFWSTDGQRPYSNSAESFWMTSGTTSGSSEPRGKGRDSMHNTTTSVRLGRNKNRTGKQRDILQ